MISVLALFCSPISPARADTEADCHQARDLVRVVGARSTLISSGQFGEASDEMLAAYFNRALAYYELGNFAEAVGDYSLVLLYEPDDGDALNNRGTAHFRLAQYELAIADFDEVLRRTPRDVYALVNRGAAQHELGRYRRAILDFDEAIRLSPKDADAYNNRAATYCLLGEVEQALADWRRAMDSDPAFARQEQAWLRQQGFYQGAVDGKFSQGSWAASRAYAEAGSPGLE